MWQWPIARWHSSKMQFAGGTFWFGSSCLKLAIFTRAKIILFHSHHQTTVTILLIIKASSSLCFSSPFNMVIIIKQRGKAPLASVGDGSGHMTLPCCRFLTDCQQIFNQPKKIFNQPKLIFNQLPDASQLMLVYAKSHDSSLGPCCRFLTDCQRIFNQPMRIFNHDDSKWSLLLLEAENIY